MNIQISIPDKRITDLLHGHGGSYSPWMHKLKGKWNERAGATVVFDKNSDEEGGGTGKGVYNRLDVMRGLAILAKESPKHLCQFLEGDDDDLSFDCAWQCIIFGRLVYA